MILIVLFLQSDFTSEDFSCMPAPLLYQMFKSKTEYPLHTAIRAKREDVVFLYLIEFNSEVSFFHAAFNIIYVLNMLHIKPF